MQRRIPTPLAAVILLSLVAAFAAWAYFGDTALRQSRRRTVGREFLPAITNAVRSHPEFDGVQVGVGTAKIGCFLVAGVVETHAQLSKLKSVIAASKPPLEVVYRVKILEDYSETTNAEPAASGNSRSAEH